MKNTIRSTMAGAALVLSACGGATDNTTPLVQASLCPSSLDYGTVFTGGAGDGELVRIQLDTTRLTWQVTYVASPIPQTPGTVVPTRAGTLDSGTLTPETQFATQSLNRCAYRLNGASLDPARPARVFVGDGVVGGTIPGKELAYAGNDGAGAIPDTTFPYFPFIGFATLDTNLADITGTYNQIGYAQVLSQNFAPTTINASVTINPDGSWSRCDTTGLYAGTCRQPGTNLTASSNGSGAFETDHYQGQIQPTLAPVAQAKGYLIVGTLRGQRVPIMIRTGAANPGTQPDANGVPPLTADDESGIAILAPQTKLGSGAQNGEYIGADSRFDYRATALADTRATLFDPFNASQASLATVLTLDYTQTLPGAIGTTHADAASATPTGTFLFTGGVFGFLDMSTPASPYFLIGAFVQ
ncbi:DUF2957 domain-containing protein [Caballeronia sp. LZ034LL]|uniref:DUF2957 domain-containing protein n=1 Tax=Caballeronia sp. LZ034LL TaxID=3038567 RepID=UPI002862C99D|nr:DUF2957 domain-containing protein [Caballeronia sp. LZ034LL]MDR5834160.1 DUF2957 domain-containing protein [Caballeronia sp. LZ034LL]